MDIASAAGIGLAFAAVIISMVMEGGNPAALVSHPAPIILVLFGTIGATMAGYTLKDVTGIAKVAMKAFMPGPPIEATESIETIVHFADKARRDGLLALEEEAKDVEDPFLRKGLQLAIDGTDPEDRPRRSRNRDRRVEGTAQGRGQVLRRHGRVRADPRHHRHRPRSGAHAREPRGPVLHGPAHRRPRSSPPCGAS